MDWKTFLRNKRHLAELIFTLILLIIIMISFSQFLQFIEMREGILLQDPLLNLFNPIDLTWLTFAVIYLSVILFVSAVIKKPYLLMISFQTYSLMIIFRAIAMYLAPLNPPSELILLNDPFVQFFGQGDILTKDLFFSGHTATMFLLFLLAENKKLKMVFLVFTFAVGACVLLQHVHYSIDVFAAPFFSYCSFRFIMVFHKINLEMKG